MKHVRNVVPDRVAVAERVRGDPLGVASDPELLEAVVVAARSRSDDERCILCGRPAQVGLVRCKRCRPADDLLPKCTVCGVPTPWADAMCDRHGPAELDPPEVLGP